MIHSILDFIIGNFKGKPWPTARLFWSLFPEAMDKNDTPYVTHKNMMVWSTQYWTSNLVISRGGLGQLQDFYGADFLRKWAKMIHPMLLTRIWRCDPLNIELQNWLFQGKALAIWKAFMELISWGNGQKWYTLCYLQEHEGVIHSLLNFKIGYFKGKPWPTARLLWSSFPEAMGKSVTHKNMKVWSIQYWT